MSTGLQIFTESGQLGSGSVKITSINFTSGGGQLKLRNGTSASAEIALQLASSASGITYDFGTGLSFPNGCYVDMSDSITQCGVGYEKLGTGDTTQRKVVGYQVIADVSVATPIHADGQAVEIYGFNVEGVGAGQSITILSGGTNAMQLDAVFVNEHRTDIFSKGITFPNGCTVGGAEAGRLTVFYRTI